MAPRIVRSHYTNLRVTARTLDDGRYLIEHGTFDGLPIPLSWGSATTGLFRAYPTLLGLPEAVVEMTVEGGAVRHVVTTPARGPFSAWGLLSAPLPPVPAPEDDFAAPEELIELIDSPAKPAEIIQEVGARLLAAPDLRALGVETLALLESLFFCRTATLWSVSPKGTLDLVEERRHEAGRATHSHTLISGGKAVGRIDVDGEVLQKEAPHYIDFIALLPWIALATAARLEAAGGAGDTLEARARALSLTERELEVLRWIREGKTNPEIGQILGISHRTVHKHVENLLRKMGAETRLAAARQSLHWRWSEDPRTR
jgi:DNA-binding CsgD family transcriptional regulator